MNMARCFNTQGLVLGGRAFVVEALVDIGALPTASHCFGNRTLRCLKASQSKTGSCFVRAGIASLDLKVSVAICHEHSTAQANPLAALPKELPALGCIASLARTSLIETQSNTQLPALL